MVKSGLVVLCSNERISRENVKGASSRQHYNSTDVLEITSKIYLLICGNLRSQI